MHVGMSVIFQSAGGLTDRDAVARCGKLLLGMDYADAGVRPLLDLEGLKQWRPGRLSGYPPLERAIDTLGFYDAKGAVTADDYRP